MNDIQEHQTPPHIPVLATEVLSFCGTERPILSVLDGTLGYGGHAELLLDAHPEIVSYIGLDQDPMAIEMAKMRLTKYHEKLTQYHTNFASPPSSLPENIDIVLLDIGVSSMQLDTADRGFSFMKDGPLDMRMNQSDSLLMTAEEIVNGASQQDLADILYKYGEEPRSRVIAKAICEQRKKHRFQSTLQLAEFIEKICPRRGKTHPATLVFQALRIAVNEELQVLEKALSLYPYKLNPNGGRMLVITFHSMEDRIVKQAFQKLGKTKEVEGGPVFQVVTKKPIEATYEETRRNKRSRSAKLRVLERIQ